MTSITFSCEFLLIFMFICGRQRAVPLSCESINTIGADGYLSYNATAAPQPCSCVLISDQEYILKIWFQKSNDEDAYINGTHGDHLNVTANFNGSWTGVISLSRPWTISVSGGSVPVSNTGVNGFCLSYETNSNGDAILFITCGSNRTGKEKGKDEPAWTVVVYSVSPIVIILAIVIILLYTQHRKRTRCDDKMKASTINGSDKSDEGCVMVDNCLYERASPKTTSSQDTAVNSECKHGENLRATDFRKQKCDDKIQTSATDGSDKSDEECVMVDNCLYDHAPPKTTPSQDTAVNSGIKHVENLRATGFRKLPKGEDKLQTSAIDGSD